MGGVAFPTPPSFFYTSLLPPAATVCGLAWLVATQRCVCVAYDCLAVASAAGGVMGLSRKFSIRRVVVSVAIGVMVATLVDVGARVVWLSPASLRRQVDAYKLVAPDRIMSVSGTISPLRDVFHVYTRPAPAEHTAALILKDGEPAWTHQSRGPYQDRVGDRASLVKAFGLPLRSSMNELTFLQLAPGDLAPVTSWGGDVWLYTPEPRFTVVDRIRILPVLFNVACFTVLAWAALTGVAAVRRARRCSRGGCAVCGYAIGKLAVCPECGTAGRATTAGSTAARRVAPPDHVAIMQSIAQLLVAWHMHVRC